MAEGDSQTRTLVIVAIVGIAVLCGLGGAVGLGMYYFHREASFREEVSAERARAEAESEAARQRFLESLPADERAVFGLFDEGERLAIGLVNDILDGTAEGPSPGVAAHLLALAEDGGGVREITSPRASTTDSDDGEVLEVSVDLAIAWTRGPVTSVRVTFDPSTDGTLTASTIEIVDAADSED